MRLVDILSKDLINVDLKAKDKIGVLNELVDLLVKAGKVLNKEEAMRVLIAREELISTGVGNGIAIPHAKSKEVKSIVACFGRSKEGVDFNALDGEPVYLIFLLLVPEHGRSGAHIKILAKISRLLKNRYFRELLKKADSPSRVLELIEKEDEEYL
ncbi:MAG: PTS sugar transporter subunit IIA [bacterium]|nr:PTS sugar transporter subunit IIA [bacterium]